MLKDNRFEKSLTARERKIWSGLTSPIKIQDFLDQLAYSTEKIYRCPLRVIREKRAHCYDGAIFAAAALRRIGYPPVILELIPNGRDDEHLVAIYKSGGWIGAVSKSNFTGLRYREPVYRTLRELVMSYFEQYFNVKGEKTLRGYTLPLNLRTFDSLDWPAKDETLESISKRLDGMRKVPVISPAMSKKLSPVDRQSLQAGLLCADKRGLFQPDRIKKQEASPIYR
jgi:hypothetical protein